LLTVIRISVVLCVAAVVTTVDGGCSGGWLSNFDNEYCLDDESKTHADARKICQSRNSELASITSDAECDYLAGLMLVNFLWQHLKNNN